MSDGDRDPFGDVPLAAIGRAEAHGCRDVEDEPRGQRAFCDIHAHLDGVGTRRRVPVDSANVVCGRPLADLRKLRPDADGRRPVFSGEQTVDAAPDPQVEGTEERVGQRSGAGPVRRPLPRKDRAHAARSARSISGVGRTPRTASMIASAPTSAASAS